MHLALHVVVDGMLTPHGARKSTQLNYVLVQCGDATVNERIYSHSHRVSKAIQVKASAAPSRVLLRSLELQSGAELFTTLL